MAADCRAASKFEVGVCFAGVSVNEAVFLDETAYPLKIGQRWPRASTKAVLSHAFESMLFYTNALVQQ
jgi:hypothetical protein